MLVVISVVVVVVVGWFVIRSAAELEVLSLGGPVSVSNEIQSALVRLLVLSPRCGWGVETV